MKRLLGGAALFAVMMLGAGVTAAQDATERAGELKVWREQCNDPDPDLRTAYLEAAIESGDTAVIRICVRQSLLSTDADIRNLGLRAALASIEQLQFEVTMPDEVAEAIEKAGDDEKQLREINSWFMIRDWNTLQAGLSVVIEDADVTAGKSTWYPLANLSAKSDRIKGTAVVIGDKVNWTGAAYLANAECTMNLALSEEGTLDGVLLCARNVPFKLSATLL